MIASKEKSNRLNQNSKNVYNKKEISNKKVKNNKKISKTNKKKSIKKKVSKNETFVNNKKQSSTKKRKHREQDWVFLEQEAEWGDRCTEIDDNDEDTLRIYCQNVNGIYDREGIELEEAFHYMRTVKAGIFMFNETHGDDRNPEARKILRESKQRIWGDQNSFSAITTSSSDAAVAGFCKPGGNMVGINGNLCGRIREKINDEYGRWCGYSLAGKDGRELLILTA